MNKALIFLLFISNMLAACSDAITAETATDFETPILNQVEVHQDEDHEDHNHHLASSTATAEMQVVLVPSELVVGPNRFAVGLFDANGRMINDAVIQFHYFDLSNPAAPHPESIADATRLQTPDGLTTIFAQERTFARPGDWGVEVEAQLPDGTTASKRTGFRVQANSPTLTPGEPVPALDTPVAADVKGDLSQLSSAPEPNPAFYQVSLAEALSNNKPTVLLFATPAFCQTRFCGPAYDVVGELQQHYGERVNFIHVEVYTGLPNPAANNWEMAPAMAAFGLSTEPWVFLIDREGKIVHRVEGLITVEEIGEHLRRLVTET